jgi:methylthioribose-1-phosphate isomerase
VTTPADPSRRAFFRRFAGDIITSAAEVTRVVADLRDQSAAEASALFRDGAPAVASTGEPSAGSAVPAGFRTPFRFGDDDTLLLVDQRRLPDALVEVPIRSAVDGAAALRDMVVNGAPAIGQVAGIALALSARSNRLAQPFARQAILEAGAERLRSARPTAASPGWAVERLLDRARAIGELSEEGEAIAAAIWDEAMAIVAEATEAHGRMADLGLAILPRPEGRPLQVLTHGSTGRLAAGQFGTALGIIEAAHHAERPIHAWVSETRPSLEGARVATWELAEAGVDHTLLPDTAAGSLIAEGRVDVVLLGADRIAANGDTAGAVGSYPLALLAARHGIPFHVVAPTSTFDPATTDGPAIPIEERAADEVAIVRGVRVAPRGTRVHDPMFDVTPAELITAFITEQGILRPPFTSSIAGAVGKAAAAVVDARARRQPAAVGAGVA